MSDKPKIAVIVSSTRPTRFADIPTSWIVGKAKEHGGLDVEVLDLRDYPMPFFDEVASNAWAPTQNEVAQKWQKKLAEFDGYIFLTAEYNHSVTGSLKNALDQAYKEWTHKPAAAMGYGGVGAARAIEHLRGIAVELQMVLLRHAVHLGAGEFFKVSPLGANGPMSEVDGTLQPALKAMLDELLWWSEATMAQRAKTA